MRTVKFYVDKTAEIEVRPVFGDTLIRMTTPSGYELLLHVTDEALTKLRTVLVAESPAKPEGREG